MSETKQMRETNCFFIAGLHCHNIKKNRSAMQTCVAYELPWSQRFFLPLRSSGSLISCREKSRKSSGTGVLTSRFFTYHWNPADFPVCKFRYKKIDPRTRLVQVWILKKIVGEAWQIAGDNLWWTSIPSRGSRNTSSRFMLQKQG